MEKYVGSFKYRVYEVDSEGNYKNETGNIYLKYNKNTGYYDMWQRGKKCGHCTKELEVVDYAEPKKEEPVAHTTSSTSGTDDFFKKVEKEIEEVLKSEVKYG